MEPFKVSVEITLKEAAAICDLIRYIAGIKTAKPETKKDETKDSAAKAPEAVKAAPKAEEPETVAAKPEEPKAEEPKKDISDSELRALIKDTRDRIGAPSIRKVFQEFGIASSIECPQTRRAELVERLKNLKA